MLPLSLLLLTTPPVHGTKPPRPPRVCDIARAQRLTGVRMTPAERRMMLEEIRRVRTNYDQLHSFDLPNDLAPTLRFDPGFAIPESPAEDSVFSVPEGVERPQDDAALAFLTVRELGALLRSGQLTAVELTQLYLERIERFDPQLRAVITVTRERALAQAAERDQELASGIDRGPLHGIPYGLKDLFAVPGYPTTWGAAPFREQRIEELATVPAKLDEAGAVLIAKTSVGALAWGDVWFGGTTKTPWDPEVDASGSSAGSASGLAAGLFAFAIGTETWGSIVSPAIRNGVTGLRPTFGRVSRGGAMALSWSMDKVGPLCREAEDCAIVLDAIRGDDARDPSAVDAPFAYTGPTDLGDVRLGYLATDFAPTEPYDEQENDRTLLDALEEAGVPLHSLSLPDVPSEAISFVLTAEAASAFDTLTRSGADDQMVRQVALAWPNVFRAARFVPAVEYLQANRLRRWLITDTDALFDEVDVILAPCRSGDQLLVSNLTGHPSLVLPHGLNADGTPTGICLLDRAYDEATLVGVGQALQDRFVSFQRSRPPGFD